MTPERQRIAIAESCGWQIIFATDDKLMSKNPLWQVFTPSGSKIQFWDEPIRGYGGVVDVITRKFLDATDAMNRCNVPDYLNDLNAMHEVEKTLSEKQLKSYAFILAMVLDTTPTVDLYDQFLNIHATATQRAEAYLKTIIKWES
jgi:hypothetical protein